MSSLEPKSIADFKQHGYLVLTDLLDHNELELLRKVRPRLANSEWLGGHLATVW